MQSLSKGNKLQVIYEFVDNFYDWLLENASKDFNRLKIYNCIDFCKEYKQLIEDLKNKRQTIKNNGAINCINIDSFERLKIIVEATKEEYKVISDSDKKDMIYFNNLLGWYESIPKETDMFINSLISKQKC